MAVLHQMLVHIGTGAVVELITKPEEKPCLMEDDTLEMIREREDYDKSIMEEIADVPEYNVE